MAPRFRLALAATMANTMLFSPSCFSQQNDPPKVDLPEVGYRAEVRSAVSAPGAQLSATNESSSVSLKLSSTPKTTLARDVNKPGFATWSIWSVTAEAPLEKGEKRHDLLHQDGWGNSTSVGFNYVRFLTPQPPKNQVESEKYCRLGQAARFDVEKKKLAANATEVHLNQLRKQIEADGCPVDNIRKYAPHLLDAVRAAGGYPRAGGFLLGVSGALEFQNIKFYTPDTLTEKKENHRPWSLAVTGGWNPERIEKLFLLFRAEHKRSYEADDEVTRCPVGGTDPTVICVTGSFAPPKLTKNNVISFESRYLFKKIAIAAIVSRNLGKDVTTVDLPVYLIGNDKVPLNGGVRLGWDSKDKDLKAGVFVGVPFAFF
ncbi:hypothetical protein [Pseudoduganella chitinolytica]|uniref:Uncharacterized protein n=1 Tax=Pseudoduganella chitinolytica TaxID=34070 RepID=A0ABY8BIB9_9BURK|nr:hypothetical protein [Pseudoduganella chitinolytica]WEF34014.1 hypothetical protein PX653_04360 [Pseudoduganella chitinolytica]